MAITSDCLERQYGFDFLRVGITFKILQLEIVPCAHSSQQGIAVSEMHEKTQTCPNITIFYVRHPPSFFPSILPELQHT